MIINQDILLTLGSENRKRIAEFFIKRDLSISERELGKLLRIPSMTTHRILRDLEGLNFINISRVGTANVWKVNEKSYVYRIFKQLFHFYKSVMAPREVLLGVLKAHLSRPGVKKVILYGSVANGGEKVNSDIDVCILVVSQNFKKIIDQVIDQVSTECLDLFGNRLEANILTDAEYKNFKNKKLIRKIEQGIVVYPNGNKT